MKIYKEISVSLVSHKIFLRVFVLNETKAIEATIVFPRQSKTKLTAFKIHLYEVIKVNPFLKPHKIARYFIKFSPDRLA